MHIKESEIAYVAAAGFLSPSLSGSLPYVWRHITVNKIVLSVSLNKTFPSFYNMIIVWLSFKAFFSYKHIFLFF